MAAPEKSAIAEARANLEKGHQTRVEQAQADSEFAQMFKDSAALLEAMWGTRIVHLRRRLGLGLSIKAASLLPQLSHFRSIPISDLGDTRLLTTTVNGTGESVKVALESDSAAPSRAGGIIDLKVEALPDMLRLSRTHGEIHDLKLVEQGFRSGLSFKRRANLEDVARFQPVIQELIPRLP